jgi:hypothetical protein
MASEWQELTRLTRGAEILVERVKLADRDIRIEGSFALPPLARLRAEDQVFVAAFVRSHGSIKAMEKLFGVSYPTVKSRLNRLAEDLDFVEVDVRPPAGDVLDRVERGEISVDDAVELL